MSNYNSNSSGRRSNRGRRDNRGRDRDRDHDRPRDERGDSSSKGATAAPRKQSLWQKILSFFGGKAKPTGSPAKTRPVYTPRSAESGAATRSSPPERDNASRPPREPCEAREPRETREPRKPEAVEVTSPKLYVGNLSFDATESDLSNLFNGVGTVVSTEIVSHKHNEKSKGFGFVTMSALDEARRAVDVLHDKDFMGRKLVVAGAKTPVERE